MLLSLLNILFILSTVWAGPFDQSRNYVARCAARAEAQKQIRVAYLSTELCQAPNLVHGTPVNYTLANLADGIHIQLKMRFLIWPPKQVTTQRADEMLKKARECTSTVKTIWAQSTGLHFDVEFDSDFNPLPGYNNVLSYLIDEAGASATSEIHFSTEGITNETERQQRFCGRLLHELGHFVGLSDEYEAAKCPDRAFISNESNPASPMSKPWLDKSELGFFLRHVKIVLSPMCNGSTIF